MCMYFIDIIQQQISANFQEIMDRLDIIDEKVKKGKLNSEPFMAQDKVS